MARPAASPSTVTVRTDTLHGSFAVDVMDDRFVIETFLLARRWEVIVDPDEDATLLVVVTAHPV